MDYKMIYETSNGLGTYEYRSLDMGYEEAKAKYLGTPLPECEIPYTCTQIVPLDLAEMVNMTREQKDTLNDNLRAYLNNFDYIKIERMLPQNDFFIFTDPNADKISYCPSLDYLNGWLWGAVQANNHQMKSIR